VADSLSRDFHLNDSDLSHLILSSIPFQAPFGLKIKPLPNEISSWLTSLLQNLPEKERWSKEPTQSSLWHGKDTKPTSIPLGSHMTATSIIFHETINIKYWVHSARQSEKVDFILNHAGLINQTQLDPPWTMYHRPSSWLTDLIPDSIEMENLLLYYKGNSEDTNPQISRENAK
jgi:hypothetical protein